MNSSTERRQLTISPIDGRVCVERDLATEDELAIILEKSQEAYKEWKTTSIDERCRLVLKMVEEFVQKKDDIAKEITIQMGRPIKFSPNEINGFAERARYMVKLAPESLKTVKVHDEDRPAFLRYIKREPLGVVLVVPAWNYPLLTAVNGIVPAILAGNTVILKHSQQTPLCAERIYEAFKSAGLPEGVFQFVHMSHSMTEKVIKNPVVQFVNFTGSVSGGRSIYQSVASTKFISCGLELGGKDPAYVREDADVEIAAENLVDGSMFNSGQCCCGIERIYVHEKVYDEFIKRFTDITKQYVLGNPLDEKTTLGPMVKTSAADLVREHIREAVAKGARQLIDSSLFPSNQDGTPYIAPQVLVDVDHTMKVMVEETFGPVVGIMKVKSDDEAVRWMNESEYGLTASIWSKDVEAAAKIGNMIETGTVFLNRCDYVDPGLAWTGVKNTGFGVTLSSFGFLQLTRAKSFHFKLPV